MPQGTLPKRLEGLIIDNAKHPYLLSSDIVQLHESRWRTQITIEPEEPVKK